MKRIIILLIFLLSFNFVYAETAIVRTGLNLTLNDNSINGTHTTCGLNINTQWEAFNYETNNSLNKIFDVVNPWDFGCLLNTNSNSNKSDIYEACADLIQRDLPSNLTSCIDSKEIVVRNYADCQNETAGLRADAGNLTICQGTVNNLQSQIGTCNDGGNVVKCTDLKSKADQNIIWGIGGIIIGAIGYYQIKVKGKTAKTEETKLIGTQEFDK